MIPLKAMHMDERYWKNPEQFDPDRFLNDKIVPGTYLPFGDGPRICIGKGSFYFLLIFSTSIYVWKYNVGNKNVGQYMSTICVMEIFLLLPCFTEIQNFWSVRFSYINYCKRENMINHIYLKYLCIIQRYY